jgi:hypothetical protein
MIANLLLIYPVEFEVVGQFSYPGWQKARHSDRHSQV